MRYAALLLLLAAPAAASEAGTKARPFGAGIILGVPFGGTVKYWLDDKRAVQAAVGSFDGDAVVTADVVYHLDDVLPKQREGRLPLYGAVGFRYRDDRLDFYGIRFMLGISFFATRHPLELFAEAGPVMRLSHGVDGTADGAAGLRYYF